MYEEVIKLVSQKEFEGCLAQEHKRGIETGSKELIFYNQINKENKIEFKKLIDVSKIKSNSKITKRDVQSMELGLIRVFKPKYNYAGRTVEYKY